MKEPSNGKEVHLEVRASEVKKPVEAGVSRAGDLKAGSGGKLVVPTPDMRLQAIMWLRERMGNATQLFSDALYVCRVLDHRDVDDVILAQARQNMEIILWTSQCMGLVELSEEFDRVMTLAPDDLLTLRHAQDVTEARKRR